MEGHRNTRQAAIDELSRIAKEGGGRLTAAEVVQHARDPASPLHHLFEWDDEKAAHEHRLDQARALIRSCQVVVERRDVSLKVPRYVRDAEAGAGEQGYIETATLRTREDAARDALVAEFARVGSMLSRARALAAYFDLVDDVSDLEARVGALRAHVQGATPAEH